MSTQPKPWFEMELLKGLDEQGIIRTKIEYRDLSFDNVDYSGYFRGADGHAEPWSRLCAYVIRADREQIDNYEAHYHNHLVVFRKGNLIDLLERACGSPEGVSTVAFPGKEIVDNCIWEDAIPAGKPVVLPVDIEMSVDLRGETPRYRLSYTRRGTPVLPDWYDTVFGGFPACQPREW